MIRWMDSIAYVFIVPKAMGKEVSRYLRHERLLPIGFAYGASQ